MKNILKDSLKLIAISFVCNFCLFVPVFLCDGFGLYPIQTEYMELVSYFICIVIEVLVFSIVGSNMKFSYKSLAVFYIISILFSFLSTALRGGWSSLMLLNAVVISYSSFARSLIAPICETTLKAFVLLISSLIAKQVQKSKK